MSNKGKIPDKELRKELKLKVLEARKRDVGRSIIRLDSETMNELEISTGDIVEIIGEGKKSSAAIAWPSYPQDQGLGIVRIDSRLRRNVGVGIDDIVITKKNTQITRRDPGTVKRSLIKYEII